jgi:hypothetical protein
MGCGCGGKGQLQTLQPKKIISLEEMRSKVFSGIKHPSSVQQPDFPTRTLPTITRQPVVIGNTVSPADSIFQRLNQPIDPATVKTVKKTVLLVTVCGMAESKYIRNLIAKLTVIKKEFKESFNFIDTDKSYLLNCKDVTRFPCTILIGTKSLYKKYFGLFEVQKALDEFLSLKE